MKYLCIGYFDAEQMRTRTKNEIDAVMAECQAHLEVLYASTRVLCDIGITEENTFLRRENGNLTVTDTSAGKRSEMIGGAFLLEAQDMDEAIRLASLHPTTQVLAGEQLGWRTEIRPVHYFQLPSGLLK